jgi:hypothetical protein
VTASGKRIIYWTWKPWRWRFYYVRHPEWGWAELLLGGVSFVWSIPHVNPGVSE